MSKFVIGCEEWCALPQLGLTAIKAKVDSGAQTSALNAFNISTFSQNNQKYVKFEVHPLQNNRKLIISCVAPLIGKRVVRSSNGLLERRYVISTLLRLEDIAPWEIEITLTNRDSMGYKMLLGREAICDRALVDPATSFLVSKPSTKEASQEHYAIPKTPLNLILLASNPKLYSNQRIIEAAESKGHKITFVNVSDLYISIKSGTPAIHHKDGVKLEDIDAVIPRLKPAVTFYGCALVRQFQSLGIFCLNDSISIGNSRDKLKCLQILANKGIPMPATGFANSPETTKGLIRAVGGPPLIIKLLEGTQGKGVVIAETHKAALSVIGAFKSVKANILVQEFVKEAQGCDIRYFIIDGHVVAAMQRKAAQDDFRSNLHLGGSASSVKITPTEKAIAIKCANSLGLKVAGVDILRSDNGPHVIEVNSSPGLEGIEAISKIDIASLMIQAIERHIYKS